MSRTVKYRRSGKYAGVCHSRIGFWAGPGQFVGELRTCMQSHSVLFSSMYFNIIYSFNEKSQNWTRLKRCKIKLDCLLYSIKAFSFCKVH